MADAEESESSQPVFYTRDGDNGRTVFGRHGEVPKWDPRVAAWADCDEANASVALAMAVGGFSIDVTSLLASVQNDLFDLVADLAVPLDSPEPATARIHEAHIVRLERAIEYFGAEATDLEGFILPGGTVAASTLYNARAVVRRAERMVWIAVQRFPDTVNVLAARYLNRLSALLFVLARSANVEHGDVPWDPEASSRAMHAEPDSEVTDLPE